MSLRLRLRSAIPASLVGLALVLGGVMACRDRSVGTGSDATVPDGAPPPDAFVTPDAALACQETRLHMGLVWDTHVPSEPEPGRLVYVVAGTLLYLGPITTPLASNPAFDREVQIEHPDGQVSVVQYYLPPGISLPVEPGLPYTFSLHNRQGFEGSAKGVVITRPTSGLGPLLFVGDTGSYGRAFSPEDPSMFPLKVYVEPRPSCPVVDDPDCGGMRYTDQLRFDSSTGAATTDVVVIQGSTAELSLMGEPWRVLNLASTHVDQPCIDDPGLQVSYLAVNTTAVPETCDTSHFYVWDQPNGFGMGSFCDVLYICPNSAAQQAAIEAASPGVDCTSPVSECPPGGLGCTWGQVQEITQSLYDQLCAISVLPNAPDRIDCNVYFY